MAENKPGPSDRLQTPRLAGNSGWDGGLDQIAASLTLPNKKMGEALAQVVIAKAACDAATWSIFRAVDQITSSPSAPRDDNPMAGWPPAGVRMWANAEGLA